MKQIELKEIESAAPLLCQDCSGLMRLIGSEPHPVDAESDLLTYCCTACEEFLVLPFEGGGKHMTQERLKLSQHIDQAAKPFRKHPICPRCDVPMWLSKIRTKPKEVEYFYECKSCEDKMSVTDDSADSWEYTN